MKKADQEENWIILESQVYQVSKAREVLNALKIKESTEERVDLPLNDRHKTVIGMSFETMKKLKETYKTEDKIRKFYKQKYNLK